MIDKRITAIARTKTGFADESAVRADMSTYRAAQVKQIAPGRHNGGSMIRPT
jgi:hypothetical protein